MEFSTADTEQSVAKVLPIVNVPLFTNAGFIRGISNGKISFFLKAEYYSMVGCVCVCVFHIFFVCYLLMNIWLFSCFCFCE